MCTCYINRVMVHPIPLLTLVHPLFVFCHRATGSRSSKRSASSRLKQRSRDSVWSRPARRSTSASHRTSSRDPPRGYGNKTTQLGLAFVVEQFYLRLCCFRSRESGCCWRRLTCTRRRRQRSGGCRRRARLGSRRGPWRRQRTRQSCIYPVKQSFRM